MLSPAAGVASNRGDKSCVAKRLLGTGPCQGCGCHPCANPGALLAHSTSRAARTGSFASRNGPSRFGEIRPQ